ncbi:MAG TPA: hypothetical protein VGN52_16910 [Burkholderiales bacterium]|jgi:hypothetical protein
MTFYKFLAAAVFGSLFLYITLRIWGAITGESAEIWKPAAAGTLTAACLVFLPRPWNDIISLVLALGLLRFITAAEWSDIVYPVFISRLGLVAVLIPFAVRS